ncbi:MAG: hypothetical protein KJ957_05020 [Candidatus Omnitrophica bacterium]|nr:hypothetical protein [Candidatus Omnitrophota bacterium]
MKRSKKGSVIYKWILIGFFLRLILMPITFHPDLLEPYWCSYKVIDQHIFNLGRYIYDNFNISGGNYLIVPAYLHTVFLWIFRPFLHIDNKIWLNNSNIICFLSDFKAHIETINLFASQQGIFKILFLFKLPYLFFDIACAFLLVKMIKDVEKQMVALKFWMVNFLTLFVIYMWGKYEIIPIFFILLSMYFARRGRHNVSLLVLGISVLFRYYSLFFVLPFAFILGKTNRERIKLVFLGFLPLAVLTLLVEGISPFRFGTQLSGFFQLGLKGQFGFFLNKITISSSFRTVSLYLFPIFYFLVLWHSYFFKNHPVCNIENYALVILLFFYATSNFYPQYFIWMMPFLTLLIVRKKYILIPHLIQILCFLIFALDGGLFLVKLFLPINPSLIQTSLHPPEVIRGLLHPFRDVIIDLSRSLFSATSLWMLWLVVRDIQINLKGQYEANL